MDLNAEDEMYFEVSCTPMIIKNFITID